MRQISSGEMHPGEGKLLLDEQTLNKETSLII
jgi:hypothetical protein